MRKNPTAPVVITDTNGKITTVHRKVGETPSSRAAIPAVTVAAPSVKQNDLESICRELLARAEAVDNKRLAYRTKAAFYTEDIEMLTILRNSPAENHANGADYVVQAVQLLSAYGEDPEEVLTGEVLGAVCRMRDALMRWEMKYDNDKSGDIEHGLGNRDALTLYLIEDTSREKIMVHAMSVGIGDATQIMHLDEGIPMALLDGAL